MSQSWCCVVRNSSVGLNVCASFMEYACVVYGSLSGFSASCVVPTFLVSLFAGTALITNDTMGPVVNCQWKDSIPKWSYAGPVSVLFSVAVVHLSTLSPNNCKHELSSPTIIDWLVLISVTSKNNVVCVCTYLGSLTLIRCTLTRVISRKIMETVKNKVRSWSLLLFNLCFGSSPSTWSSLSGE